jgi:CDP-diacylglycerol--serine O-phosphatidyltransferase
MTKNVPNFITLLNLLSGFAATVLASKGYNEYAALLIIAGGIFDFCDGFAARLLKSYSDIGKELDSLADVVTFGIAPGAIVLNLLIVAGMAMAPAFVLACLIPAASALRLAKFNTDATQSTSFRGLATPASAFTVISFVIAAEYSSCAVCDTLVTSSWFIGALSLFLAVMMLVNTRMFSLKFSHLRWGGNEERYLLAGISLLLLLIFRLASPPLIMAAYIVISLVFTVIRGRKTPSTAV